MTELLNVEGRVSQAHERRLLLAQAYAVAFICLLLAGWCLTLHGRLQEARAQLAACQAAQEARK